MISRDKAVPFCTRFLDPSMRVVYVYGNGMKIM